MVADCVVAGYVVAEGVVADVVVAAAVGTGTVVASGVVADVVAPGCVVCVRIAGIHRKLLRQIKGEYCQRARATAQLMIATAGKEVAQQKENPGQKGGQGDKQKNNNNNKHNNNSNNHFHKIIHPHLHNELGMYFNIC